MAGDDLTLRMGATLGAVLVIDVAFALVVAGLFEPWLSPAVAAVGVESTFIHYALLVGGSLAAVLWAQVRYARQELLAEAEATAVDERDHPELHSCVTRIATLADMRVPTVAIADTDVPNSFAVGGFRSGTIVLSRGMLSKLDDEELDAVVAHELVHLKNNDALVMTLASFLPALVSDEYSLLDDQFSESGRLAVMSGALVGAYVLSTAVLSAPMWSVESLLQFAIVVGLTIVLGGVALGLLATPVVFLSRHLSRHREFVADRDGARLVGNPAALANVLQRLDDEAAVPAQDARDRYRGLDGLCLLPHGFDEGNPEDETFHVETRAHPPTPERIARLRRVAASMESA